MPVILEIPGTDVSELVTELIDQFHPHLRDVDVTFEFLSVTREKDDDGEFAGDHPLKLHGYPCAAIVKINAYKLRVQGHADVLITINGEEWETLSRDEQRALMDHELTHVELKTDAEGNLSRDDLGRPKLKMRLHDHQFGWFDAVVRRHGKASIEHQQAETFVTATWEQMWLPFVSSSGSKRKTGS